MSGQKIIDGLRDAINGDMTSVTIDGQRWMRADAIHADHQEIMGTNNQLRNTIILAMKLMDEGHDQKAWETLSEVIKAKI